MEIKITTKPWGFLAWQILVVNNHQCQGLRQRAGLTLLIYAQWDESTCAISLPMLCRLAYCTALVKWGKGNLPLGNGCKGSTSRENDTSCVQNEGDFLVAFKLQCLNPALTLPQDVPDAVKESSAEGLILPIEPPQWSSTLLPWRCLAAGSSPSSWSPPKIPTLAGWITQVIHLFHTKQNTKKPKPLFFAWTFLHY